jgi:hypothetical protein
MNKIQVYIHGENLQESKLIDFPEKASANEIIEIYLRESGNTSKPEEWLVFIEEETEPRPNEFVFTDQEIKVKSHFHFHRCRTIATTIFYNGEDKFSHFSPSTKASHILKKALEAFRIKEVDAGDFRLKLDDKRVLNPNERIGSFATHSHCSVKLYLTDKKPIHG